MEKIEFNKCQTPLEELELEKYPKEVQEQFWDFLNNVPFIKWMVSKDRPLVSELPRDDEGKAIIDVTKPPILENCDYFRRTAKVWEDTGSYTNLRPNRNPNSDFGKWLREERRRGWNGLVDPSTGMWITGDYYWMLNYCPMHLIEKRKDGMSMRVVKFPKFWDGQFLASHYFYMARKNGHHAAELSSRGRGKTSLGAAMLAKRFVIGEFENNRDEIQCLVTAADRTKLAGTNQILSVFVDDIDFCAKNTQFASSRLKSSKMELAWKMGFKKSGIDVEYGSKNEVTGVISGVNQDKLNGSRGVLYIVEEAGIFKDLLSTYNMIRPSVEQGSSVFGEIVLYGTSGNDMSDFTAFSEMIYSPNGYNLQPLENVFDKEGQGRKMITTFYPAYLNYDDSCMDENGNSDVTKALLELCDDRYKVKYGSTDVNTITKRISQYPITPQEAIIRSQGNMFPVTELTARLNQIDNNPSFYDDVYVGDLVMKDGEVSFQPTGEMPIRDFPLKDNKASGALEIYEMPQKNSEGKVPTGRYIISCLKEGELVSTKDGLKPVEEVTLEDKLINKEGEFVSIRNLQKYWNEDPVYKIKLGTLLRTTTFTGNHPIYAASPEVHYHGAKYAVRNKLPYRYTIYNFDFKEAKDLKEGDVVMAPNIYRKELPFMDKWHDDARIDRRFENPLDKEDFWWLFGVIAGDGWACSNGHSIHISFNALETKYIEKTKRIVNTLFNRAFTPAKDGSCKEYSFCCKTLNKFIHENLGAGARNKHLAEWIKYLPFNLKKQLLLGYLASDGSVTCNNIEYVSMSLKLLNDMQDILFSLGIMCNLTKMKHYDTTKIVNSNVYHTYDKYHLRISGRWKFIIRDWNPDDLKLRKLKDEIVEKQRLRKAWFSDDLKYIYFRITSITTEEYVGPVYNFECDTHTFMCDYIPTHNCDPYDNDQSGTMSLGSMFVLDLWTDRIVAEYTGRKTFADDLYELVRKTCLFYNAKCMYENNLRGVFAYFSKCNSTYLLAETPEYLKDRQLIKSTGFGNSAYGIRATPPIINYGFRLIRDWLMKPVTKIEKDNEGNDVEVTVPNLYNIKSRGLIKELMLWNPVANFDRIMSAVQLMLYREEKMVLYQGNVKHEESYSSGMENDEYWSKNYPGKKPSLMMNVEC